MKQVDKSHYDFNKYVSNKRWTSLWHQLSEVMSKDVKSVIEVGPGNGLFTTVLKHFGYDVTTVDLADDLQPDIVADATNIPVSDDHADAVVAFQVLEHMPYEESLKAVHELGRIANRYLIISLPNAKKMMTVHFRIPGIIERTFLIKRPFSKAQPPEFNGQHYWEINKKGYDLQKVQNDFCDVLPKYRLLNEYRVAHNPYHHFFVYSKDVS